MSNFGTDPAARLIRARVLFGRSETEGNKLASADAKNEKVPSRRRPIGVPNNGEAVHRGVRYVYPISDRRFPPALASRRNPRDWPPSRRRNIDPSREVSKRTLEMQRSAT